MKDKRNFRTKIWNLRQLRRNFDVWQFAKWIIKTQSHELDLRRIGAARNEAAGVGFSCLRIAHDLVRVAKAAQNPALQNFSGDGRWAIRLLTKRTTNREEIVASHDHGNIAYPTPVHRVGVIANMNDGRLLPSEAAAQFARKQDELVDVTQPFGN